MNSIKHFPGHGDTATDSHLALPVLNKTKEELLQRELLPFQALLPQADSVMLGHLLLPKIDENNPASLSPALAQALLRKAFNYNGCVLTDALLMHAIGDEKTAAWKALQAGVDILLVPQNPFELIEFLEGKQVPQDILDRSYIRQEHVCAFAQQQPRPTQEEAFCETDFSYRVAQKAICTTGVLETLPRTQTVHYLEIGNESALSSAPFLTTLQQHGIHLKKYDGQAQRLLLLCFRRYQAFQGKILLEEKEVKQLQAALQHVPNSTCILFASPWALPADLAIQNKLFTFSPSPEFQITAAEILLGLRPVQGTLPIVP